MNTFGRMYKTSIYGESHGDSIGVVIDGMKPGIKVDEDALMALIERRKPGGIGTTKRVESDIPHITSGVFNGFTTGFPIHISFENNNTINKDYSNLLTHPRPSHADYAANVKFNGFQDYRGGGHFSGRLTLGLVASGYFASLLTPFKVSSKLIQIGEKKVTDNFNVDEYLKEIVSNGDSVGGIIEITVSNMIAGVGEPYFDSVESVLSHLLFSVPAVKGVEFGAGFNGVNMLGSEFNDCIIDANGKTKTNNNGGINGGISNGNDLVIRVMMKPTPSIYKGQETFNFKTNQIEELVIRGRHDACIARRAMVVLESVCHMGLADLYLTYKAYK